MVVPGVLGAWKGTVMARIAVGYLLVNSLGMVCLQGLSERD